MKITKKIQQQATKCNLTASTHTNTQLNSKNCYMKKTIGTVLGILILSASCQKINKLIPETPPTNPPQKTGNQSFDSSLEKWEILKKKKGNSYVYETSFSSWTGYRTITKIIVFNGKVVKRTFEEYKTDPNTGELLFTDSYTEENENVGLNDKGAVPATIDELYASCSGRYLLVDEKSNTIYFDTNEEGILSLCGFYPDMCMDDCFQGFRIDSFSWTE